MPIHQLTSSPTESDLETRIQEALARAFPWLKAGSIRHQTKFSFTFGRTRIEVDGSTVSRHEARADILLTHKEQPLAVLELKRPGGELTAADTEQGMSYARMLDPRPPLVVVTNGLETRSFETHTGKPWQPATPSEEEVAKLFSAAGAMAAVDMQHAMDVLLSPRSRVWVEAVRAASLDQIAEMTGDLEDSLQPFGENFAIPRSATGEALAAIQNHSLVIVEGAPLSGKSNVIREMVWKTAGNDTLAMLYLEADADGAGALQHLANVLSGTLSWQVNRDEVRQWLRNLSVSSGPSLVIALDGLGSDRDEIYRDLQELTSGFGVKLKIILGLDDTVADRLVVSPNGRKTSAIGRKAKRVHVGPLSDDEFDAAMGILFEHRVGILTGGKEAEEYRSPWVLRAVTAAAHSGNRKIPDGAARLVPSLLGTELIGYARKAFADRLELRRQMHGIACAIITEIFRQDRAIDLVFQSTLIFQVPRRVLACTLDRQDIDILLEQGVLRQFLDKSEESMFVVRLPELLAAALAMELANNVVSQLEKNENAAEWLSTASRFLPLGDVIAAQAILDSEERMAGLPMNLLEWFLNHPPTQESVKEGFSGTILHPEAGPISVDFGADGVVHLIAGGGQIDMKPDQDDFGSLVDTENWLILSHVAAQRIVIQSEDGMLKGRVDSDLLLELGSSPFVLRRIGSKGYLANPVHSIPGYGEIVCHKAGFIEPILMAFYKFLSREGAGATEWIRAAIDRQSLPLLHRITIVLDVLESSTDPELAAWGSATNSNLVQPALSQFPPFRCD